MLKVVVDAELIAVNVAESVDTGGDAGRHKEDVVPPSIEEGFAIANAADGMPGKRRALVLTALFSGLRSSELRGLRWDNIDFDGRKLSVAERHDEYGEAGSPKSKNSRRDVPPPARVVNALREWRLACPKGELGLVFPAGDGGVMSYDEQCRLIWQPVQVKAGGRRQGRQGQVFRHSHGAPLVRVVVPEFKGRGRARAQNLLREQAARALDHKPDGRHLRPLGTAEGRWRLARQGGGRVAGHQVTGG
jgi:integrase